MSRFNIVRSLSIATVVVMSTSAANALMVRPELGMGMTDYLGSLAKECPATFPGLAMKEKWRPGMLCPTAEKSGEPVVTLPNLIEPTEGTPSVD